MSVKTSEDFPIDSMWKAKDSPAIYKVISHFNGNRITIECIVAGDFVIVGNLYDRDTINMTWAIRTDIPNKVESANVCTAETCPQGHFGYHTDDCPEMPGRRNV